MSNSSETLPAVPGYEILDRIGRGGMGDVFLARQQSLGRQVAIKFVHSQAQDGSAELASRIENEARLMADSAHANIVTVFDRGTAGGRPFLVMEHVDGQSLRDRLRPGKPMAIPEARRILASIARALVHLHSKGILHRDLKPENVLLDRNGSVKVCDFGIAIPVTELSALAQSGEFAGTLDYMAPEQRHRLPVDERADQYALAVLAYEILTGQKPLGFRYPRPSELNGLLDPQADHVLLRGLQRDPDDRYPSVSEFAEALDAALARRRPRRWARHAVIWSSVLLVLIAAGWSGRWLVRPSTPAIAIAPFSPEQAKDHQERWARHLQCPVKTTNSLGMSMVLIPPGEFMMGSTPEEIEESAAVLQQRASPSWMTYPESESPQHLVRITRAFHLAATEATVSQFRRFVEATGYQTDAEKNGIGYGVVGGQWQMSAGFSWSNLGEAAPSDDWPVVNVSFHDAVAFCEWLTRKQRARYRLPTEAEWEYACRAGSTGRWCFGDDPEALGTYGRVASGAPARVADCKPNAYGLHDMHGNVFEWCADWYSRDYYQHSPIEDPAGPPDGAEGVLRSGSARHPAVVARSASRVPVAREMCSYYRGFRVAREVSQNLD